MSIRMPTYNQLSEEQKAILEDADFDENLIVIGPPGTGKTVIAMHRAQQLGQARDTKVNLIMYNQVLSQYTSQWDSDDFRQGVGVSTYHKWVWHLWRKHGCPGNPPKIDNFVFDWPVIQAELLQRGVSLGQLVVDEGQDLPVSFFKAIGLLTGNDSGGSSFCIVADENQRLDENTNASIDEIREAAILGDPKDYQLTRNYRNTREIALLANKFYVGLQTGMAEIPEDRQGPKPRLVGFADGTGDMVKSIARHASNNPGHSILVICPTKGKVKSLRNKLHNKLTGRKVRAYLSGNRTHTADQLETGQDGSITLVHWRSMKGVEADAVFVPHLEEFDLGGDSVDGEKMRLYVLFSRARQILELQYDDSTTDARLIGLIRDAAGTTLEQPGFQSDGTTESPSVPTSESFEELNTLVEETRQLAASWFSGVEESTKLANSIRKLSETISALEDAHSSSDDFECWSKLCESLNVCVDAITEVTEDEDPVSILVRVIDLIKEITKLIESQNNQTNDAT